MDQTNRPKEETKAPVRDILAKVAGFLLGTFVVAVSTYVLGLGVSVRSLDAKMDFVVKDISGIVEPIDGSRPRQIMIQNTRYIERLMAEVAEIEKDDKLAKRRVDELHNEFHTDMTKIRKEISEIREKFAISRSTR